MVCWFYLFKNATFHLLGLLVFEVSILFIFCCNLYYLFFIWFKYLFLAKSHVKLYSPMLEVEPTGKWLDNGGEFLINGLVSSLCWWAHDSEWILGRSGHLKVCGTTPSPIGNTVRKYLATSFPNSHLYHGNWWRKPAESLQKQGVHL